MKEIVAAFIASTAAAKSRCAFLFLGEEILFLWGTHHMGLIKLMTEGISANDLSAGHVFDLVHDLFAFYDAAIFGFHILISLSLLVFYWLFEFSITGMEMDFKFVGGPVALLGEVQGVATDWRVHLVTILIGLGIVLME